MPLTNEELAAIDKLLGRIEKNARAWRFTRWLFLGFGLLSAGLAFWLFWVWGTGWMAAIPSEPSNNVTSVNVLVERCLVMGLCVGYVSAMFLARIIHEGPVAAA